VVFVPPNFVGLRLNVHKPLGTNYGVKGVVEPCAVGFFPRIPTTPMSQSISFAWKANMTAKSPHTKFGQLYAILSVGSSPNHALSSSIVGTVLLAGGSYSAE